MLLKRLELVNFRNHKNLKINFSPNTILVGQNGVGKTNILEAISMISTGFSWRTRREEDFIHFENTFSRIIAESDQDKIDFTSFIDKKKANRVKINGLGKKKIDLLGVIPTVLFIPENLSIITGPPVTRRRFLNFLLMQVDKKYVEALITYNKIIRARNALLESISRAPLRTKELIFWNKKLVQAGNIIISKRAAAIEYFNDLAKIYLNKIGKKKLEHIKIKYLPSVDPKADFLALLKNNQQKELHYKMTLYGPHRDDLEIIVDGKSARNFSSRGEIRSIVLAIKRIELDFLRSRSGKDPLLLLDDIFSELDSITKNNLHNLLEAVQMIFTTSDDTVVPKNIISNAKIIKLSQ